MKTKIFSLLSSILFIAAIAACDHHTYGPDMQARGQLSFDGLAIDIDDSKVIVESRAGVGVDVSHYLVTVIDNLGEQIIQSEYVDLPEVIDLAEGDYTVIVESHDVQPAEFDRPYYKGEKKVTIVKNKVSNLGTIDCKFSSICVSMDYSDAIWKLLGDDFMVRVRLNDEAELTYVPDLTSLPKTKAVKGYFKAVDRLNTNHTLIVNPIGTVSGESVNHLRQIFTEVQGGQQHIIKFKIKNPTEMPEQTGTVDFADNISIEHKVETNDINHNLEIEEPDYGNSGRPGQETPDVPGIDDPVPPTDSDVNMTTPDATAGKDKLQFDVPTPTTTTASGLVNITAESGLAHLYLEITSTNDDFAGVAVDMFGTGRYDMAYPTPGTEEGLDDLNLSYGAAILNKKEVPFDITRFIPLLTGFKGTHTFKLTVVSNKSSELSKSLIFVAQ
ncbi:MAG: DUF4493 domain-containing protein [Muribaculaceae bacterium]|nr:DUF4493 domain-containing protein [Muribaculaceae bacterium]